MPDQPPVPIEPAQQTAGDTIAGSAAIMRRLRAPDGCPWDREQTFDTIKRYTLEETYEVFDAIERRAWPDLRDELGDLLLQVLFYAQMADEAGYFTLADVADALNAKLIRRHPHIFGDADATDSQAVLRHWEQIKSEERRAAGVPAPPAGSSSSQPAGSSLDTISRSMPAMLEAAKLGSRAARAGFDWPDAQGLFAKLEEETAELHAELARGDRDAAEAEFGDLLFTMANLARHLQIDPETALRRTNAKFRARYRAMEQQAGSPEAFAASTPAEKEQLWVHVKAAQQRGAQGAVPDHNDQP